MSADERRSQTSTFLKLSIDIEITHVLKLSVKGEKSMKKLTIEVKEVTYKRLKKVCENAKRLRTKEFQRAVRATDNEIAKMLSFAVNEKAFNDIIKELEEITDYERYNK